MKKLTITLIITALLSTACAKREPHTVMAYQPGDEKRSCDSLLSEISYFHNKINKKSGEQNNNTGKNVALGVTGLFLIVPWFFMDLSGAEKTELESYKMRIERLQLVALEKRCEFTPIKFEDTPQEVKEEDQLSKKDNTQETE